MRVFREQSKCVTKNHQVTYNRKREVNMCKLLCIKLISRVVYDSHLSVHCHENV